MLLCLAGEGVLKGDGDTLNASRGSEDPARFWWTYMR